MRFFAFLLVFGMMALPCYSQDFSRPNSSPMYQQQPVYQQHAVRNSDQSVDDRLAGIVAPTASRNDGYGVSPAAPAPRMGSIQAMQSIPQNLVQQNQYQYVPQPNRYIPQPTQPGAYINQSPQLALQIPQPYMQAYHQQLDVPDMTDVVSSYRPQNAWTDANQNALAGWTFDQVMAATLTSDPRLRIGQQDIQIARAEYWTSSLRPNPNFAIEASMLPYSQDRITPDDPGGPPELGLSVEFPIDWFLFAKRKAAMNSAGWEIRQTQAEYADLIRERIVETATLFYEVLEAKAILEVERENTKILYQLETIVRQGVAAGGMPEIEWKRIRLELLQNQQDLLEAETEFDILKAQLRSQFGSTDYDPTFDVIGDLDAPKVSEPMPLEAAFAMAQQNRPDIRALRMQVAKSQADITLERRNAYPEVAAMGGFGRQYQLSQGEDDYSGWGVGISLSVPLFDRNQGNRRKAQAELAQNTYKLQTGIVDLRAEIVEADRNFRTADRKSHAIAEEELRLSREVRDAIIESYQRGGSALIDVLDAERSYRETYRLYVTSRADYWRAVYLYNSAVGINSVNDVRR